MRIIDSEASKTYLDKIASGFFMKYMDGKGLDISIGDGIESILPQAEKVEVSGKTKKIEKIDDSQDFVYLSGIIGYSNYGLILKESMRVLKPLGYLTIVLPNSHLTGGKFHATSGSIVDLIEHSFDKNTYRIRFLEEGDKNFDYSKIGEPQPLAQTEITLVIQKLDIK